MATPEDNFDNPNDLPENDLPESDLPESSLETPPTEPPATEIPAAPQAPAGMRPGGEQSLSETLRGAREAKGLEIGDIAKTTHVRSEYLKALEEGRFEDLPENIYTKNYLKLYAKEVGLEPARMLALYARERGQVAGEVAPPIAEGEPTPVRRPARRPVRVGAWLPTLLVVALVAALGVWLFNNVLFPRPPVLTELGTSVAENGDGGAGTDGQTALEDNPSDLAATPSLADGGADGIGADAAGSDVADDVLGTAEDAEQSLLTLTTDPPGAEVSLDGFVIGETPITQQPLTADPDRELRISLAGYQEITTQVDLTQDTVFQPIVLTSLEQAEGTGGATTALTPTLGVEGEAGATGGATGGVADDATDTETNTETDAPENEITLNIADTTWLEVYQSTQRGVGERLVYTTVQAGDTFTFDLPVYLRVGNAAGVEVTLNGQEVGALGSRGEVIDQSYEEQ